MENVVQHSRSLHSRHSISLTHQIWNKMCWFMCWLLRWCERTKAPKWIFYSLLVNCGSWGWKFIERENLPREILLEMKQFSAQITIKITISRKKNKTMKTYSNAGRDKVSWIMVRGKFFYIRHGAPMAGRLSFHSRFKGFSIIFYQLLLLYSYRTKI